MTLFFRKTVKQRDQTHFTGYARLTRYLVAPGIREGESSRKWSEGEWEEGRRGVNTGPDFDGPDFDMAPH